MSCCGSNSPIGSLFCLWVRSGFQKSSVAGAIAFWPPDPPFYKFQRISAEGKVLNDELLSSSSSSKDDTDDDDDDDDYTTVSEKSGSTTTAARPTTLNERAKLQQKRAKQRRKRDIQDAKDGVTYRLELDPRLPEPLKFHGTIEAIKLYSPKSKSHLAVVIYRQPKKNAPTKTILYSHGNAADIGAMSMMQSVLANSLKVNVVMYDYSGYGESGGMPLERNTYSDIQTVYDYCVEHLAQQKNPKDILLYGESVGSGPSCYLGKHAAHHRQNNNKKNKNNDATTSSCCGGLVLHAPFTSGMRVLTPNRTLGWLDIFPNIDRIQKVECPVLIIHGMKDTTVDITHGMALYQAIPKEYKRTPWWVPNRGHNNVCQGKEQRQEYIRRLKHFLNHLEKADDDNDDNDNDLMDYGAGCNLCMVLPE